MNPRNSPSYRLVPIKAAFNQHEIILKQYFYILWSKHQNLGRFQQPKMLTDRTDKHLGSNALKDLHHVSPIPSKRIHTH